MNTLRQICLLVILTGLTACSEEKTKLSPLSESSTILAFGDSLTYGTGASKDESYPSILNKLTKIKVVNGGVPGEVSSNGKTRLAKVLQKHQPDLVILCHGGNDLIQKLDRTQVIANLKNMIAMIRSGNSEVILLSVPRPGLMLKPAAFYDEIAEEMNVPIISGTLSDILSNSALKSDAAHPNAKGYFQMAKTIGDFLVERKAINQLN